ncbi:MAG TPA: hypothetical protein VF321_03425 [Gaiellaceae bacterium]
MVEIRVAVPDDAMVHGLMRRFVALFGRAAVSFDAACSEVHVRSDWGSRAVDQIVGAVESWLAEDGVGSATLAIDDVAYTVVAP